MEWLARFTEHYRQNISKISADTYRQELSDMSAAELDAACREAVRTSEYMPNVATIRNALKKIKFTEVDNLSGLDWDPQAEIERLARKKDFDKLVADGKEKPWQAPEPAPPRFKVKQSVLTLDEQKEILRKKGFL